MTESRRRKRTNPREETPDEEPKEVDRVRQRKPCRIQPKESRPRKKTEVQKAREKHDHAPTARIGLAQHVQYDTN